MEEPSWSWSYGSWIYNYLCNQCLLTLTVWVRIPLRRGVLDTTLYDKVCQWLVAGWRFSLGTPVSSTNKTDRHDITEILLKVALNNPTLTPDMEIVLAYLKQNRNQCNLRIALIFLFSGTSIQAQNGKRRTRFVTEWSILTVSPENILHSLWLV